MPQRSCSASEESTSTYPSRESTGAKRVERRLASRLVPGTATARLKRAVRTAGELPRVQLPTASKFTPAGASRPRQVSERGGLEPRPSANPTVSVGNRPRLEHAAC
jgi:hypothetical protein